MIDYDQDLWWQIVYLLCVPLKKGTRTPSSTDDVEPINGKLRFIFSSPKQLLITILFITRNIYYLPLVKHLQHYSMVFQFLGERFEHWTAKVRSSV